MSNPDSDALFQRALAIGRFFWSHNRERLTNYENWLAGFKDQPEALRLVEQGDDWDIEVYHNDQWRSLNGMLSKALTGRSSS